MDSPEDGSSCGFVSMETLECGGGSGARMDSHQWKVGHSSKEQASHEEMRGFPFGASGKPHLLVLESRLLTRDTWNPKQLFR